MTVRIDSPNLSDTEALLAQVLEPIIRANEHVAFLCERGTGRDVVARIRVMISRKRKKMRARGKVPKVFQLCSTIHPETHDGKTYDCIVLYRRVNESHIMREELEGLMAHG